VSGFGRDGLVDLAGQYDKQSKEGASEFADITGQLRALADKKTGWVVDRH
jgi:hypothetical protein